MVVILIQIQDSSHQRNLRWDEVGLRGIDGGTTV